ncbi:MAG: GNAT family N-acetyltransferase [Beijerinckiaceae bacterium]|jgi:putative hemolysin|nr:GNAT family N-acetyltransferase [Beijerinckiaceae bacterium]
MLNGSSSDVSRFDVSSFRVPEPALAFLSSLPPQIVPFPARQLGNLGLPKVLGRSGHLQIRLARSSRDVRRAQRLRYQVFHEEMAAIPNARCRFLRRDIDAYDAICDHLLVVDTARMDIRPGRKPRPMVVGTYRLLRQEQAGPLGFYSQGEFDIAPLLARHPGKRFLELGRSCVLPDYRTKKTVELLWHGIWAYVRHHRIDVMIGCASLEGTDPAALATRLGFLHHHARATGEWSAQAHATHRVPMDRLAADQIDAKAALKALPPLLKGYLRIGARFGDGAVIDHQFGTTDVLVVLPVAAIDPRYVDYYGAEGERYAA